MCRLYGFAANQPTRLECSLVEAQNALLQQSRLDRRGRANPDGWGIAHYESGIPRVERRTRAAYQDLEFSAAAQRIKAESVIAHVRAATIGGIVPQNTHPFTHGPWTFAHNGTVTGFEHVGPLLLAQTPAEILTRRRGTTDSEVVFLWLLGRLSRFGLDPNRPAGDVTAIVEMLGEAIPLLAAMPETAGAGEPAKLNLMLTDGQHLVASRWGNTLWWTERDGVTDCSVCSLRHADPVPGYRAVVIASEPITSEAWHEVPEGSIVAAGQNDPVSIQEMR